MTQDHPTGADGPQIHQMPEPAKDLPLCACHMRPMAPGEYCPCDVCGEPSTQGGPRGAFCSEHGFEDLPEYYQRAWNKQQAALRRLWDKEAKHQEWLEAQKLVSADQEKFWRGMWFALLFTGSLVAIVLLTIFFVRLVW